MKEGFKAGRERLIVHYDNLIRRKENKLRKKALENQDLNIQVGLIRDELNLLIRHREFLCDTRNKIHPINVKCVEDFLSEKDDDFKYIV